MNRASRRAFLRPPHLSALVPAGAAQIAAPPLGGPFLGPAVAREVFEGEAMEMINGDG